MIIKIICLGICVCILSIVLSQYQKSFVLPLQLIFAIVVIALLFNEVKSNIEQLFSMLDLDSNAKNIFLCLIKCVVISLAATLACDLSNESGNKFVSSIIDISARMVMLITALPFLQAIIKTSINFIK